jgi:hypothetical protein
MYPIADAPKKRPNLRTGNFLINRHSGGLSGRDARYRVLFKPISKLVLGDCHRGEKCLNFTAQHCPVTVTL